MRLISRNRLSGGITLRRLRKTYVPYIHWRNLVRYFEQTSIESTTIERNQDLD